MIPPAELTIDLGEHFPHLRRAPIVEAVIHWQTSPHAIDPEALRQRFEQQINDYPNPKAIRTIGFEAKLASDAPLDVTPKESWLAWRLTSQGGQYVAQLRRDGLVFSRLAPYENWPAFSAEAHRLWNAFKSVAEPTEVQRLGVRFINRIAPVRIGAIGSILTRPPARLGTLGLPVRDFVYQSTHDVPGHPYRLNVVDTIQSEITLEGERPALILDVDAFTTRPISTDDVDVDKHLEHLRWLKNKAFFNLIKKSALKRLERIKDDI